MSDLQKSTGCQAHYLDNNLDDVLHDLLSLLLVASVLLQDAVGVVQHLARRVVDEGLGDLLAGHLSKQLLLRPQAQPPGVKPCSWLRHCNRSSLVC